MHQDDTCKRSPTFGNDEIPGDISAFGAGIADVVHRISIFLLHRCFRDGDWRSGIVLKEVNILFVDVFWNGG